MKAGHRHQLKTNELADWIANLPQWAKENLIMIIVVCAVVVLAIGSYVYIRREKGAVSQKQLRLTELIGRLSDGRRSILSAQPRGMDLSYLLVQLAQNLDTFAQNAENDEMASFALFKRAEALRAELHYHPGIVSKRDLTAQINLAKASYSEALQKSSSNPSLRAMAEFGLGLCEEELGNFEQAKQIYHDLAANPHFEGTTTLVQAKQRLETMADYQKKVVFMLPQRPKPPVPPRVQPVPPDINLPKIKLPDINLVDTNRADTNLADINLSIVDLVDIFLADTNLADANMAGP